MYAAAAQQGRHCDPALPLDLQSASGYQDRGDRCEGRYRSRNVSASDIVLVAFDASQQELTPGTTVVLRWGSMGADADSWLTAQNLRRTSLYRMDRRTARGEREFRWDTHTAAAGGVREGDLGAVLTGRLNIGGAPQRVYLPVTTGAAAPVAGARQRRMQFRLGASFQKLSWRISTYAPDRETVEGTTDWTRFSGRLDKDTLVYAGVTLQPGRCFYFEMSGKGDNGLPAAEELYLCEPAK